MNREQLKEMVLQGELQTPSYFFDVENLYLHVDKMQAVTRGKVGLCYAMKANPFLISPLSKKIEKIEVCSPGELEICKKNRIAPSQIIFSGVNKTKENINAALDYGVKVITLESMKHWRLLKEVCDEDNYSGVEILPRLSNGLQFGMNEEEIMDIAEETVGSSQFHFMGIHYFSGTQKKKLVKFEEELVMLDELLQRISNGLGLQNLTLEYGAGLAVPYFEGEDFDSIYANLYALVGKIVDIQKESSVSYTAVLELGRFFAFSCGTYITKVDDVKINQTHPYIIVDGGIHQLNYYGQNMAMRVPQMELLRKTPCENEDITTMTVCGSLCTMADVLVRKWKGSIPDENDCFLFYNAGAYSVTEAPALFLSRTLPQIYFYSAENGLSVQRPFFESYEWNSVKKAL